MKEGFKCICALVVLFGSLGELLGQTTSIYIRLDESSVSISQIDANKKRTSVRDLVNNAAIKSINAIGTHSIDKNARTKQTRSSKYLNGIYRLQISEASKDAFIDSIRSFSNVLDVEVEPELNILLIPNDELIVGQQNYLNLISAFQAWDITKGDEDIVIGVSDTGFDLDHEDLINKIYLNEGDEIINGIDDDNNGYIDDYSGWDFSDSDNNTTYRESESNSHGSNVAGVVSAEANNAIGVAGLAYESQFLPLKIARSSDGQIVNAYESIIYAADMGCSVVNLSWGGVNIPSSILQSIIDYAVLDKDMVVVAAAGNTDAELDFYPASYEHVLSVGITGLDDVKSPASTYSYNVDLMAPGTAVISTNINDTYSFNNGSSFSAPQVAATAALVKSVYPDYDAVQIMEHVRMTADDIYNIGNNMDYFGKLGKGRLNMFRAVSETEVGAMRMYEETINSTFDDLIFPKDTIEIVLNFVNILRDLKSARVLVESESDHLAIINPEIILGNLHSYDSVSNVMIQAVVSEVASANESMSIRFNYSDSEGYDDFEYVVVETADSYLRLNNGVLTNTLGSEGNLGYASDSYTNGSGFEYGELARANVIGLMMGQHTDSIFDNVFNSISMGIRDGDFTANSNVSLRSGGVADWYARGSFNNIIDDQNTLLVEQEILLWESSDLNEIAIHEYYISNISDVDMDGFKVGFYVDFDIGDLIDDYSMWDDLNKLGYSYDDEGGVYCGIALLSSQTVNFNAIDVTDTDGNYLDISDEMNDADKFSLLSQVKTTAGGVGGQDVAQLLVANFPEFEAKSSEKVAFALLFGDSLEDLNAKLLLAKSKYEEFLVNPDLNLSLSTCEGESVSLSNDNEVYLYKDVLRDDLISSGTQLVLDNITKDSVLYYVAYENGVESDLYKVYIEVSNPVIDFRADPEVLYLGDTEFNSVQFIDETLSASSWSWEFSNGFLSSAKNPFTFFNESGVYAVNLDVVTELGCLAEGNLDFEVQIRGEAPIVEDQLVCQGDIFTITASNSDQLRFYHEFFDDEPFHEGLEWQGMAGAQDEVYYVSSQASGVESQKVLVNIMVDSLQAHFSYFPDTLNNESPELIYIQNESVSANSFVWLLNDEQQQSNESLTFDVSALESLEITLNVTSINGCESSATDLVQFMTSSKPGINQNTVTQVCNEGYVTSRPVNGSSFVFYADEGLTQIVEKGEMVVLGPITSDTSFYIVNISSYHISEPTKLEISTIDFETGISVSPDSLKYGQPPNVVFEAVSSDQIKSYQWYVDGELIETAPSVTVLFYDIGDYNTTLIAESSSGCYDTLSYPFRVYQVLDVDRAKVANINIHPNPAKIGNVITVGSDVLIQDIQMYNASGKLVWSCPKQNGNIVYIESDTFESGMYILNIKDDSGYNYFDKVIID